MADLITHGLVKGKTPALIELAKTLIEGDPRFMPVTRELARRGVLFRVDDLRIVFEPDERGRYDS